eukprot:879237-Rhodomonas_salina.1
MPAAPDAMNIAASSAAASKNQVLHMAEGMGKEVLRAARCSALLTAELMWPFFSSRRSTLPCVRSQYSRSIRSYHAPWPRPEQVSKGTWRGGVGRGG